MSDWMLSEVLTEVVCFDILFNCNKFADDLNPSNFLAAIEALKYADVI
jgi:hypothetical protein